MGIINHKKWSKIKQLKYWIGFQNFQFKPLSLDLTSKFNSNLVTFNDGIDRAIGCDETTNGGFSPGTVTEIAGQAGSGKTQLCLHLCAAVQLPAAIGMKIAIVQIYYTSNLLIYFCRLTKKWFYDFKLYLGGLGGRAIYLDADGSFCAERMNQIAEATKRTALKQMESIGTKYRYDRWN